MDESRTAGGFEDSGGDEDSGRSKRALLFLLWLGNDNDNDIVLAARVSRDTYAD